MDRDTDLEIISLFKNKDLSFDELKEELHQYHESDIADAVELLSEDEAKEFFSKLTPSELGELLPFFENPEEYLEKIGASKAADIIEQMDADDAVDILEDIDEDIREDIMDEIEKEAKEDIELINKYDEDEIGSLITTNYITIKKGSSVKEAMKTLISEAPINDNISELFVVNSDETYYGTIILKDLIIAREGISLDEITKTSYPTLNHKEHIADVLAELTDIDLDIIPVVDDSSKIIGVITASDIIETVNTELGEDYVKFAGLTKEEEIDESFMKSVFKRIPWLSLLLCLNILTASVLSGFEGVFAALPALVLFQSLVLDACGNSGTQSLAITIRSLTQGDITKKNFKKNMFKELLIGLVDGLLAGIAGFAISFIFLKVTNNCVIEGGGTAEQLKASTVVAISLICAIPITSLLGMLFPIILTKIHVDPAVASGPLITTLSDISGVCLYYSFAILLFNLII